MNYLCRRNFGSKISRKPSPNKLIPKTVMKIAKPGKIVSHGALLM
jgi:hypothetical protein